MTSEIINGRKFMCAPFVMEQMKIKERTCENCQILLKWQFWNGNAAYERLCVKYYASTQSEMWPGWGGVGGCGVVGKGVDGRQKGEEGVGMMKSLDKDSTWTTNQNRQAGESV